MNYRSISDLNQIILKRLYIIPRDIDLVVGHSSKWNVSGKPPGSLSE